jgi:hypothetical protein
MLTFERAVGPVEEIEVRELYHFFNHHIEPLPSCRMFVPGIQAISFLYDDSPIRREKALPINRLCLRMVLHLNMVVLCKANNHIELFYEEILKRTLSGGGRLAARRQNSQAAKSGVPYEKR